MLLQFNGPANKPSVKLSVSMIQQRLQLSQSLILQTLQTLSSGEQAMLTQLQLGGNTRKSQNDITYELNEEFAFKSKDMLVLAHDEEALKI